MHLTGFINFQNDHIWSRKDPQEYVQVGLPPFRVTVVININWEHPVIGL